MKYQLNTFIILVFLFFTSVASFNAQNTKKQLLGKWEFDYNKSVAQMDNTSRLNLNVLQEENKLKVETAYKERIISFDNYGNFYILLKDGKSVQGTWNLTEKEDTLKLTSQNNEEISYRLLNLSIDELVLEIYGDQSEGTLFLKSYYKKFKTN